MGMTLEEKLACIDDEIRTLHHFCIGQGYSVDQIEGFAAPILQPLKRVDRQRAVKAWKHRAKVLVLVALLTLGVFYVEPIYTRVRVYSRLAQIKLIPLWDWTTFYSQDCLISNPYYTGEQLTLEDCEVCDGLSKIERISNVTHHSMAEDYLKRDIPVVVTDAMEGWPVFEKFSFQFLYEIYKTEPKLKDMGVMPCMFATNVRAKGVHALGILRRAANGDLKHWYAHWENCGKVPSKFMRKFIRRPYFLPPMVESSEANWIFLSSNYNGKLFKPIDIGTPMAWVGVVKGQIKVKVSPKDPCHKSCETLYTTLHAGEILAVTDLIWYLDYLPNGSGENIAVAAGGQFD